MHIYVEDDFYNLYFKCYLIEEEESVEVLGKTYNLKTQTPSNKQY